MPLKGLFRRSRRRRPRHLRADHDAGRRGNGGGSSREERRQFCQEEERCFTSRGATGSLGGGQGDRLPGRGIQGCPKKAGPRMRELAPAARGRQDSGSRNLGSIFSTTPVQETVRGAEEQRRREPGQRGGADQVGGRDERRHGLEGARPLRRPGSQFNSLKILWAIF